MNILHRIRAVVIQAVAACTLVATALVLLSGAPLRADEEAAAKSTDELSMSIGLAQMLSISDVRFAISSGRVHSTCRHNGFRRSANSTRDGRDESLTISSGNGRPSMRYRQVTAEFELLIDIADGDDVSLDLRARHAPDEQGPPRPTVAFRQPVFGPITLTVGESDDAQTYSASTVWHMLLLAPVPFQEHVAPLLGVLRNDWQFAAQAQQIEEHLFRAVDDGALPDVKRWQQLVDALGSDAYARRVAADRELRNAGQPLLPFLRNLDQRSLDAEQWFRVRRIIESQSVAQGEDQPHQVAGWLIADIDLWTAFLTRPDEESRARAATHLRRLVDVPLQFDPAADADVRARQIEQFRATQLAPTGTSPP